MKNNYKLGKLCTVCGKPISDRNKGGRCSIHRDRTGPNNPFFGKTHSAKTVENLKIKTKTASILLWQDPIYRDKVIKGVSKPRRPQFKLEQSARITQWYKDNPDQKEIRSKAMKESWKNGNISYNEHSSYSTSKIEKELFYNVKEIWEEALENYIIYGDNRRYLPDIYLPSKKIIIELYGDYWHGNPDRYKEEDIVHHHIKAKNIWDRDREREENLIKLGYKVIIIWASEYKKDREKVLSDLYLLINT